MFSEHRTFQSAKELQTGKKELPGRSLTKLCIQSQYMSYVQFVQGHLPQVLVTFINICLLTV